MIRYKPHYPDFFYTYIYYDPSRNNEPIYVGKGKKGRAWNHMKRVDKHPFTQRLQLMKKNNIEPIIDIIDALDESHAFFMEECCIQVIGRKDLGLGSLLNLTNGGEGASGSKGHVGLKRSCMAKKRMSIVKKGKPNGRKGIFKHADATKRKISNSLSGRIMNDSWIEKQKERIHSIDTKSKMAESQKIRWRERKDKGVSDPIKPFNRIQGPDRIYNDVYEAAECNNALISAIYRWCDPKTPVKSRPGWSIIKEGQ